MSILNQFDLSGKTALVTGCRRGLGQAMAEALAEAGADIIAVNTSKVSDDSAVAQAVKSAGRKFTAYACDLGDRDALNAFIAQVMADFPQIDILVNNAGINRRHPAAEFPSDDWDAVLAVNLDAAFILSREIGKAMLARGAGKIIFTASLMTYQGGVYTSAYSASKGAIGQLIMALSNEWAGQGVQVNGIAPGYFLTDMTQPLHDDPVRGPSISDRIPAGRWGDPADLKGITVFLASAASDYVTGATIPVDGGWLGR